MRKTGRPAGGVLLPVWEMPRVCTPPPLQTPRRRTVENTLQALVSASQLCVGLQDDAPLQRQPGTVVPWWPSRCDQTHRFTQHISLHRASTQRIPVQPPIFHDLEMRNGSNAHPDIVHAGVGAKTCDCSGGAGNAQGPRTQEGSRGQQPQPRQATGQAAHPQLMSPDPQLKSPASSSSPPAALCRARMCGGVEGLRNARSHALRWRERTVKGNVVQRAITIHTLKLFWV